MCRILLVSRVCGADGRECCDQACNLNEKTAADCFKRLSQILNSLGHAYLHADVLENLDSLRHARYSRCVWCYDMRGTDLVYGAPSYQPASYSMRGTDLASCAAASAVLTSRMVYLLPAGSTTARSQAPRPSSPQRLRCTGWSTNTVK
eukprot:70986-Rhodomonas_salina.4